MRKNKTVTIAEIAKKAGVSRTTISFYLNGKYEKMSVQTRNTIEKVIKETGYIPNPLARSLNNKSSNLIGVVVQSLDTMDKEEFLGGVEEVLHKNGYQMILSFSNRDLEEERKQIEKMKALNVDGYIVTPSDNFDLLWNALGIQDPLVVYNPIHVSPYPYWIQTNDYRAAYDALDGTANAGYTRFVLVSEEPGNHMTIVQRCKAFDDLTRLRHLHADRIYLKDASCIQDLDVLLTQHVQVDESTCFYVTSAQMLRQVFLILRRYKSLIPNKIGLLGFNALEWADMVSPTVTTIVQPSFQAGMQAARLLLDGILEKNQELPCHIFQCVLHHGESVLIRTGDMEAQSASQKALSANV